MYERLPLSRRLYGYARNSRHSDVNIWSVTILLAIGMQLASLGISNVQYANCLAKTNILDVNLNHNRCFIIYLKCLRASSSSPKGPDCSSTGYG